jgi:hypothetical protein
MIFSCLKTQKGSGEFISMVDEFTAAGAKGRTDGRQQVLRPGIVEISEGLHGFAEDIKDTAAPAAMDGGRDLLPRVEEEYGLAIGMLDHYPYFRLISDDGVVTVHLKIFPRAAVKMIDPVAMDLPGGDEKPDSHYLFYPLPVDHYRRAFVTHRKTAVQRCKRSAAAPAMPVEHGESAECGMLQPEIPAWCSL